MSNEPKSQDITFTNCPCCGKAPHWVSDYDERSGWGDETKGYISCDCGLTLGAPLPSSPHPKYTQAALARKWNCRT